MNIEVEPSIEIRNDSNDSGIPECRMPLRSCEIACDRRWRDLSNAGRIDDAPTVALENNALGCLAPSFRWAQSRERLGWIVRDTEHGFTTEID